jgi:hypothetical protein
MRARDVKCSLGMGCKAPRPCDLEGAGYGMGPSQLRRFKRALVESSPAVQRIRDMKAQHAVVESLAVPLSKGVKVRARELDAS